MPRFAQAAGWVDVIASDDIALSLPEKAVVKIAGAASKLADIGSLADLAERGVTTEIVLDNNVKFSVCISDDFATARRTNAYSRLEWLLFQARAGATFLEQARTEGSDGIAFASGDRIGGRYRTISAQSAWTKDGAKYSRISLDIFHKDGIVSFNLDWTGLRGSSSEKLATEIFSSVRIKNASNQHD